MCLLPRRTFLPIPASLENEETIADDFRYVMTRYHFEEEDHHFSHIVVVGHMPVSEYCHRRADSSVRLEYQKNIISIDGGNAVKIAGQLNALIISRNYMETVSDDLLDRAQSRTDDPSEKLCSVLCHMGGFRARLRKTREAVACLFPGSAPPLLDRQ